MRVSLEHWVLLVDHLVIGLEIYARQRHYLLISAQPGEGGRVHLVQDRLQRGVASPSPFMTFYVRICVPLLSFLDFDLGH